MKICIVGNSPNVFNSEHGNFIDSCDLVIRINNFKTDGFENYVGSKTNIVVHSFAETPTIDLSGDIEVWCSRPVDSKRSIVANHYLGFVPNIQPSKKLWNSLVSKLQPFWRPQPSSGMAAIAMVLERYPGAEIYIVGFDDEKFKKHYFDPLFYDDDSAGPVGHNWTAEWKYIEELLEQGHISKL